jgi:muramidase (phage lysozyme)
MSNVFGFRQPPPGFITEYHGGGGKGGTTTQSVSIPPEVLARYNAVNARAENVAQQPFQQYGGQFVAGLNPTQQAGQAATSAASQAAQPYFGAATGLTLSGAQDVGALTKGQIGYYQDPAMLATLAPTQAALQQQQGQQLAQQQSEAIKAGAFGGDRAGMQRQLLRGQQQLGMGQALAPIYQQAYQTGLQTAQQQQGVVGQDLARRMQAGQQIAGLGTGAQQAALQGAQAQMAAGQVEQQTQQADLSARYQQFLQERGYPFQVAQFLANIAMGTGALSGSTTTTQQPGGFFSDKRLKKDIKEIGETHDGQPIYSYKYKNDDRTQIGLMAQDVEKRHPEAVGLAGGYKTVDYKKATEGAERTHKDMGGGLMPDGFDPSSMGGAVTSGMAGEGFMRGGYVGGGLVGGDDWAQILAANKAALGMYGGAQPMGGPIGAGGIVPQASIPTPKLVTAGAAPQQRPSGMSTAMQTGKDIASTYKGGKEFLLGSKDASGKSVAGLIGGGGELKGQNWLDEAKDFFKAEGGLIVGRHAYAYGGESQGDEAVPYDPSDVMGGKDPMEGVLKAGSQKHELMKPGQVPGGGGGSGLGDAATIASSAAKIIPFLASLSDARAKDNIRPVGKTFDGQNIYSYNIGEGPTQMGLMAQEVLRRKPDAVGQRAGLLTVDYDRATEDAAPYASGGLIPRERHDGEDGNVVGSAPKYLIEPQNREDMDPHWQNLITRIYGGEGGYDKSGQPRYNIRQGGKETFDIEAGHPGKRPAQGGVSSASGAGQFINDTWNRVTGGAPMTKGYQDAATKTLAAQDYKSRTGRDLDVDLKEQGLAPDIIKTLAPTWTSLGNAPSPPGLIGRGMQPAAPPSGGGGKKSLGETVTSEGFVVPALGFLGSMLASNRPNFGQALGEGIVGGVGAYQQQQKQLADIAKTQAETAQTLPIATARNIEAANKLATGLMQYNASLPPGSPKLTLQQYAKIVGYTGPIPSEAEQAAKSTPGGDKVADATSRNWSLTPDEKAKLVIKYPDGTMIPAYNDPSYLSAYANNFTAMGDVWAKEQAEAARAAAEKNKIQTFDINGNLVTVPGAIEAGQKQKIGEELAKEASEFNKEATNFMPESQKIVGALGELENIVSQFQTGADAPARANLDRVIKAIDPENKFKLSTGAAGNYDTIVKDAMFIGLAQLSGLSPRAPAAMLEAIKRQIPDGRIDPDAVRNIIGKIKADTEYKQKMYKAFDVDKHVNVNKFQQEFMDKNPYDEFLTQTKKELKPGAGTQQQREQASTVPTVRNNEEYNAIKSGSTYIAPDGTTRRKP